MDKVLVWARQDLTEAKWKRTDFNEPLYWFHSGLKKEHLEGFHAHVDPYISLGATRFPATSVYQPVTSLKQVKNKKYYYPVPFQPHPNLAKTWKEIAYIEPEHLKKIKKGICKILILNVMEGWSFNTHFKNIIDVFIEKYNLNYHNFVICSGNMLTPDFNTKSVYYNWWEQHMRNDRALFDYASMYRALQPYERNRKHKFICLNRRPHAHRLLLSEFLYTNNYHNDGILTCCKETDNGNTIYYETSLKSCQEYYPNIWKNFNVDFLDKLPLVYKDGINAADDNPTVDTKPDKFYNSWLHIVTETYAHNGQSFFSEKIFKPIIYWQPFILLGAYNDLKNFRSLGYKTFDGIIDESYDDVFDNAERLQTVFKEISRIISMDNTELKKLYSDCHEILTHNFYHWMYRQNNIHADLRKDLLEALYG